MLVYRIDKRRMIMPLLPVNDKCIGCTLCFSVCPKKAISFQQDLNGFYVAKINSALCVNCGKCHNSCIMNKRERNNDYSQIRCFSGFSKNNSERIESTSGGLFFLLAKKIIDDGGYVCGCVWDDNFEAKHIVTNSFEDIKKMRGSKYVQSNMGDCFFVINELLRNNRKVLFSGTGCQVSALNYYIKEEHKSNLLTCSVICGGVPSPKVWKAYKDYLEKMKKSKITSINLRAKKRGWLVPELEIRFENKKSISQNLLQENLYGTNFGLGLFINDCCMNCNFKLNSVNTDIILSDHWGINLKQLNESQNLGSSAIIALSKKGIETIKSLESVSQLEDEDLQNIIDSHRVLTKDHDENPDRLAFFNEFNNSQTNIYDLLRKYYKKWEKRARRGILYRFLYKTKLYSPLYLWRWKKNHKYGN